MRLIDADNFKESLINYGIGRQSLERLIVALDDAPTVEAAPVVHGKWDVFRKGIDYQCSECYWSTDFNIPRNFCPNCGAKMNGKAVRQMIDMKEKRKQVLKELDEIEQDISKLIQRINATREAEATMDDEALLEWDKENGDLEEGLIHIVLL